MELGRFRHPALGDTRTSMVHRNRNVQGSTCGGGEAGFRAACCEPLNARKLGLASRGSGLSSSMLRAAERPQARA